jgi:hypothetical protein
MSTFIREQIEKRLKELRYDCGLQRLHLRNAFGRRWSGCPRRDPEKPDSWDLHWENLQAQAQKERPEWVAKADKALADFIAEHRAIMGPDWPGTDHGRLCWSPFSGGCPIDQHYCQLEENHEGAHADDQGAWPVDVTNEHEWHKLRERCLHPSSSKEMAK